MLRAPIVSREKPNEMLPECTELPGGLRVISLKLPHVRSVALQLCVDVGTRYERLPQHGISHFLEHMAFKGTRRRSALDIATEFDAIGGNLNAYTSMEQTVYYAKALTPDTEKALDILSDIIQHSTFVAEEMEREREVILQEIAMHVDTPDDYIFDRFTEVAYPNQPLGRSVLGTEETVKSFKPKDLQAYVASHYHAGQIILAAAGDVDHDWLVAQARAHFKDLPGAAVESPTPGKYTGGEIRLEKALEQVHIVLGMEGASYRHKDFRAFQILATLLGGGMSSRLFQELREKRGLAYTVEAFNTSYADSGVFSIYLGTGEEKVTDVLPIIMAELHKISEKIEEEEIVRAKNQLKANLVMSQESHGALSGMLARHLLAYGRFVSAAELINEIDAVTISDIKRIAVGMRKVKPSFAVYGPKKAVNKIQDFEWITSELK